MSTKLKIWQNSKKIPLIVEGKLKDLTKEAKKVAEARDLKNIGQELKKLYEITMKGSDQNV